MGKFTVQDNARETGVSTSKAAAAEHVARDDATKSGFFSRGDNKKNSERFPRNDESGKAAGGFWGSIFGGKSKED